MSYMGYMTWMRGLLARVGVVLAAVWVGVAGAAPAAEAWAVRYNGPANNDDRAQAVAVDAGGSVCVAGYSTGSGSGTDYTTIKYASTGAPVWTNRYNGPGNSADLAAAVAVDTNGNVYVTGSSTGAGSGADYATIKYSSAGAPVWTNRYNGPANSADSASAVAVDTNGNVYVTGASTGSASLLDYLTIKYSSVGAPVWTNRYNGPGNGEDQAQAVAVDTNGNVYVTGASASSANGLDYATIKYSSAGAPLWTNRYNGPGNFDDLAQAIALDSTNNVCVTGTSFGSAGAEDYATLKYSSAGAALWTNRYNGPGNSTDQAQSLTVDGSNNVYVAGASWGGASGVDYATLKYSGAGVPLWTNRYGGSGASADFAQAVAADTGTNVYVTGYSPSIGTGDDYVTIRYSGAGTPLWTNRYNGPANNLDQPNALAVDAFGNVYVTGASSGSGTVVDFATLKYASALPATPPVITAAMLVGTNLVFGGTGGNPGAVYYVVGSTDPAALMTNWGRVGTNTFGAGGSFTVTNAVVPAPPRHFLRLQVP